MRKLFLIGLILIVSGCVAEKECPTCEESSKEYCGFVTFVEEPNEERFNVRISNEEGNILTKDCWQELIKQIGYNPEGGRCFIEDVTVYDEETSVGCICYYGKV